MGWVLTFVIISCDIVVVGRSVHDCFSHVSFVIAPDLVLLPVATSHDRVPDSLGHVGHCTPLDPLLLFLAPRTRYHDHDAQ